MAYTIIEGGGITTPEGFLAGACYCHIKSRKAEKPDLAVLYSQYETTCAALFTQNRFAAAHVLLGREVVKKQKVRAMSLNSGNANAATGSDGLHRARMVQAEAARLLGLEQDAVLVCSTGVIGQTLPVERIFDGLQRIVPEMSRDKGTEAAHAIMTTDLKKKEVAMELKLSGGTVRVGAMAKGSGMIHPNMATVLCYVTTDAKIELDVAQAMLKSSVDKSLNMLTVDGDTSTNDSTFLLANGASGIGLDTQEDREAFAALLDDIYIDMARRIAADGEGATHLLEVEARGLSTEADARRVARSVVGSSLFKAAVFGRDANWGRIIVAAGYSNAQFDPEKLDCTIQSAAGSVTVMKDGYGVDFNEAFATRVLTEHDVLVILDFKGGDGRARAFGCDLSYDYIRINADYRT